jgi:hypothetical protein
MFNLTAALIDPFVECLQHTYHRTYGRMEPDYPEIIGWAGRMALEHIANSDALYHTVEHTILVTLVGQDILSGKHFHDGGVSPWDWLHVMVGLLCHDIGYVRGVCQADRRGLYTTGQATHMITLPAGATDASLTSYHVDRGQCFVRERFPRHAVLDADVLAAYIERTRFPVPEDSDHQGTADYPGLVRAADLIGQMADPRYLHKLPALFYEFAETGVNTKLGYTTPDDLRRAYPRFFWQVVAPYIEDGVRYLRMTQDGQQWIANLHAHVFAMEHAGDSGASNMPALPMTPTPKTF